MQIQLYSISCVWFNTHFNAEIYTHVSVETNFELVNQGAMDVKTKS